MLWCLYYSMSGRVHNIMMILLLSASLRHLDTVESSPWILAGFEITQDRSEYRFSGITSFALLRQRSFLISGWTLTSSNFLISDLIIWNVCDTMYALAWSLFLLPWNHVWFSYSQDSWWMHLSHPARKSCILQGNRWVDVADFTKRRFCLLVYDW